MKTIINQIKEIKELNENKECNGYTVSRKNENIYTVSKFGVVLFEGNQIKVAEYISKNRNETLNSFSQSEIDKLVEITGKDKRTILLDIEDSRVTTELYRTKLVQTV
ncbi:hypothetical protein MOC47_08400 [Bacillus spizizenii]|nr:hypothetical protein [Bacillus spizizenii]MCY7989916.1 hypothetical protein [Bacillus spizizenii]MCY8051261.1 hypothetical protein [Bacillus spizizenii]MCY8300296.1 hypothetical protein [Bacillus spizizenii]MCY8328866.1 hypothetical protein [Bacillus spizizenii]